LRYGKSLNPSCRWRKKTARFPGVAWGGGLMQPCCPLGRKAMSLGEAYWHIDEWLELWLDAEELLHCRCVFAGIAAYRG